MYQLRTLLNFHHHQPHSQAFSTSSCYLQSDGEKVCMPEKYPNNVLGTQQENQRSIILYCPCWLHLSYSCCLPVLRVPVLGFISTNFGAQNSTETIQTLFCNAKVVSGNEGMYKPSMHLYIFATILAIYYGFVGKCTIHAVSKCEMSKQYMDCGRW